MGSKSIGGGGGGGGAGRSKRVEERMNSTYVPKLSNLLKSHGHKLVLGNLQVQYIHLCLQHRKVLLTWSIVTATFFSTGINCFLSIWELLVLPNLCCETCV